QMLLLALTALVLPAEYAILVIWLVLGIWGFANGLQRVAFNVLLAKTIPPERRGRLLGLRNTASGATIFVVSIAGGLLVQRYGFPRGYGLTFLLGFVLACLGLVAIAALRETAHAERREDLPFSSRIGRVREMLRNDTNFRRFVSARLLATAARGAVPFYIILVREELGLTGERLAALTILFVVAQSLSTLGWGLLADRGGFRGVFLAALPTWMIGVGLLIVAPSLPAIYLVFALVGAGVGGFMLASQQLVLEFGTSHELPTRIAGSNALSELAGMLGFLIAGFLADQIPLVWLFGLAAAVQALAVIQMLGVREPRHLPAGPGRSEEA
ncbi:MAG: MFS transporter, partial [Myxococcales bacterium]|nr:MFS transporter [Myxococcales bacterium]